MMSTASSMNSKSRSDYIETISSVNSYSRMWMDYLRSGLLVICFIFTTLFAAVAIVWCIIDYFAGLINIIQYSILLEAVTIILFGFLYYIWIVRALNGYTYRPTQLRELLEDTIELARCINAFACTHHHLHGDKTESKPQDASIVETKKQMVMRVLNCCHVLTTVSLSLFTNSRKPPKINVTLPKWAINDINKESDPHRRVRIVTDLIMNYIKYMEDSKCLHTSGVTVVMAPVCRINEKLRTIRSDKYVINPKIFDHFMNISMAFYFFIIIPFKIVTVAGWYTMIIYPILMHLLVGVVIARAWLKDPFDNSRPLKIMDYDSWITNTLADIEGIIKQRQKNNHLRTDKDDDDEKYIAHMV